VAEPSRRSSPAAATPWRCLLDRYLAPDRGGRLHDQRPNAQGPNPLVRSVCVCPATSREASGRIRTRAPASGGGCSTPSPASPARSS